ncbi:MAG: hypothetical protein MUC50_13445 [Myxococcota bacterium]|nr:hypothetical protein [Myxococcota bacterium]
MSRTLVWTVAVAVVAQFMGCAENEQTFFIEHVKAQPEAPECSVAAGDDGTSIGLLDVWFNNPYLSYVLVTNHAISREAYESGKAESNGIFIDYSESYVLVNGGLVGERVRTPIDVYLEPESSDVVAVTMIPVSSLYGVQRPLNCNPNDLPADDSYSANPAIAVVRLFGHTAGGTEVETQELNFTIQTCCGCLLDQRPCQGDCTQYCDDEVTPSAMCTSGVANGSSSVDCRNYFEVPCNCPTD